MASHLQTKRPGNASRGLAGWRRTQNGDSRLLPARPAAGSREPAAGLRTRRGGSRLQVLRPGSAWHGQAGDPRMRSGDSRQHPGRPVSGSPAKAAGRQPVRNPPHRPEGSRRFTSPEYCSSDVGDLNRSLPGSSPAPAVPRPAPGVSLLPVSGHTPSRHSSGETGNTGRSTLSPSGGTRTGGRCS